MILVGFVMTLVCAIGFLFFIPLDSLQLFLSAQDLGIDKDLSNFLATVFFVVFLVSVLLFVKGAFAWITIMLDSQKRREWREKKCEKNAIRRRKIAVRYSNQYSLTIEEFLRICARFEKEVLNTDSDARIWVRVDGHDAYIDDEKGSEIVLGVVVKAVISRGSWNYIDSRDSLERCCPRIEGEYGVDEIIKYQNVIEMVYIPTKIRIKIIKNAVKKHNKQFPQYAVKLAARKDRCARDAHKR